MDKSNSSQPLQQLDEQLELYLVKKAPALPANIKELIVQFAPWITLIIMVVALPAILFVLGLGAIVAPFAFMGGFSSGASNIIAVVVLAITVVLELMSLPGLFNRKMAGWKYAYYAALVGIVADLVSFNIIGGIIGGIIRLYFLYQIKSYYK
jgi:hypothetical protein